MTNQGFFCHRTVEYDPLIKSQLESRNQLQGFMWCKFGHVPLKIGGNETRVVHRVASPLQFGQLLIGSSKRHRQTLPAVVRKCRLGEARTISNAQKLTVMSTYAGTSAKS